MKQGGAIRADDTDPQERGEVHVIARLNETERPARMRSCSDAKQLVDRHENHKSTANTNESLSEANCVNMSVMGNSWDKAEDWVEQMRIIDAEAKKTRFRKDH